MKFKQGNIIYENCSHWIKLKDEFITDKHSLYQYTDGYECDDGKSYVCCFNHKGVQYALNQFMKIDNPITFGDVIISGYDYTNYWSPYLIELEDSGERIRLWTERRV